MSGSNITPVITPTALTNHFCTILNITINMKDVSKNNLINTEVLAYYERCHMEVKICMLYSLGQSEVLLLLFLSNGQRVGSQWGDNMSSSGDKDVSSNPQSPKS